MEGDKCVRKGRREEMCEERRRWEMNEKVKMGRNV